MKTKRRRNKKETRVEYEKVDSYKEELPCDECGAVTRTWKLMRDKYGRRLCKDCYDKITYRCWECGKMFNRKQTTFHIENGNIYCEEYWVNGKKHRLDGPAVVYYYENGNIHCEQYWVNDKYHRLDSPAHIAYRETGEIFYEEYWIEGNQIIKI